MADRPEAPPSASLAAEADLDLLAALREVERAEDGETYGASLLVGLPADPREAHGWLMRKVAILDALQVEVWRAAEAMSEEGLPRGLAKVERARAFLMGQAAELFTRAVPREFHGVANVFVEQARSERRKWDHASRLPLGPKPSLVATLTAHVRHIAGQARPRERRSGSGRGGGGRGGPAPARPSADLDDDADPPGRVGPDVAP